MKSLVLSARVFTLVLVGLGATGSHRVPSRVRARGRVFGHVGRPAFVPRVHRVRSPFVFVCFLHLHFFSRGVRLASRTIYSSSVGIDCVWHDLVAGSTAVFALSRINVVFLAQNVNLLCNRAHPTTTYDIVSHGFWKAVFFV